MKNFFRAIYNRFQLPSVIAYLQILNLKNYFKWLFSSTKISKRNEFDGKKIVLIALYEKGILREDILNLLEHLKSKDFYIIGVNTLKLSEEYKQYFDYYIERYNYGRDFGSYKIGFQTIFSLIDKSNKPTSVLMINDSVFYSYKNLDSFIGKMSDSSHEIIAATENFEIEHHWGSFCINFSKKIISNKKFRKYWKNYSLSDMRPKVIKKGEMGLSKIIKKVVSAPSKIKTLYSVAGFENSMYENEVIWKEFDRFARKGAFSAWHKPSLHTIHKLVMRYVLSNYMLIEQKLEIESAYKEFKPAGILNFNAYREYLHSNQILLEDNFLKKTFISHLCSTYVIGSQIHQNYGFNYFMGCGILKLDAVYRGMMSYEDLLLMKDFMDNRDYAGYSAILNKTVWGEDALSGWKIVAFLNGYI